MAAKSDRPRSGRSSPREGPPSYRRARLVSPTARTRLLTPHRRKSLRRQALYSSEKSRTHIFEAVDGATRMRDILLFESPLGMLGRLVDRLVLAKYLTRLLEGRNRVIRAEAERCAARAVEQGG